MLTVFRRTTRMQSGLATVAAAGTNQATATALSSGVANCFVVTAADGTKGVILPASNTTQGKVIEVYNDSASQLKVYPQTSGKINTGSADAAVLVGAYSHAYFLSLMTADYWAALGAEAGGDYVTLAGTETLTNKTLTSPVLTTPQINDTTADHQYVIAVNELAADRTVTLPLLTGADEFVFKDHAVTLTNKTLTSPVLTTPQINDTSLDHQYIFAGSELAADRTVTLPLLTGADEFVFKDHAVTMTNKTLTSPVITQPGSNFPTYIPHGAHAAAVAPAAAIPITNYYSTLDSTAGATTQTLADGAVKGQLKKIQMIADGGDDVVTPANLAGGTTITFADVGDYAILVFDGTDWVAIELGNAADGVTAPVLA